MPCRTSLALSSLNSTLIAQGINASNITTSYYSVYKTFNQSTYTASEGLDVVVPDIKTVNHVLLALASIPDVYVTGVQGQLSDSRITQLRAEALQGAVSNATNQASALVAPLSVKLTNISINNYFIYAYPLLGSGASIKGQQNGSVFFPGNDKVVENINAAFSYGK